MRAVVEIVEGLRIALESIRANKMRATLTTLGIIIGVLTVTLMGTALSGLKRSFQQSMSFIGADVLYVERREWFTESHTSWLRQIRRRPITLDQVRQVADQMTSAQAIAPMTSTRRPVHYRDRRSDGVTVVGTTEQFLRTSATPVAEGRFFSASEVEGGRPVCVLGADVATNLFLTVEPIGQRLRIGHHTFEVVGIMERQGQFLGQFSMDNFIVVPVRQFVASFWTYPDFQIQVKAARIENLEDTREELRGVLRKIRHVPPGDEDDFAINQQEAFLKTFNRIGGTIAAVGFFITGLSLFVGGIGIMNIMFVSVAERTREIGIRKAVGAKRRAILVQFLLEAATICLLGGALALGLAWPITFVMNKYLPAALSPDVVGLALGVAAMTGLVSGFFPAWRAARMNPVDALRNE